MSRVSITPKIDPEYKKLYDKIQAEINKNRYWEIEYSNGKTIDEKQADWNNVKKLGIVRLTLFYDGRRWDLYDKVNYLQKKRASCIPGIPESFTIESRSIGYIENTSKVWYTVDEGTGIMKIKVE